MILVYLACGAAVLGALAWRLAATAKGAIAGAVRAGAVGPVGPLPLTVSERRRGA
jgi:hypothetical protein